MTRSPVFSFGSAFAIVALLVVIVGRAALAQSSNPDIDSSVGTWKFNADKSTSTAGNSLKSRTEVVEATPTGGYKVTRTDLRADGTSLHYSYTFKYDGKEYPVTGALFDTIAQTRLDANTTTFEVKKAGSPYHMKGRLVISKDGKTRMQMETGIGPDGKATESTRVYDKQ